MDGMGRCTDPDKTRYITNTKNRETGKIKVRRKKGNVKLELGVVIGTDVARGEFNWSDGDSLDDGGCFRGGPDGAESVTEARVRLEFSNDSQLEVLASDNSFTTPSRCMMVAYDKGVRPPLSDELGLTPSHLRSSFTAPSCPPEAANDRGVRPL